MAREYMVRLAGIHDADLINLARNYDIGVKNFFKECLLNYVQKIEIIYDLPKPTGNEEELNKISFQIEFDDNNPEEAKVIRLLDSIKGRYKNTFIKNTVRLFVKVPVTTFFIDDPEVAKLVESYNEDSRRKEGFYPSKRRERRRFNKPVDTLSTKEIKNDKSTVKTKRFDKETKHEIPEIKEEIKKNIHGEKVNSVHYDNSPEKQKDSNILNMFDNLF